MTLVGFIGAYDKIDFMLYLAKMIAMLDKKVLLIDATQMQKTRYIVPTINSARSYITEFEKVDVAVGFNNYEDIKSYIGISETSGLDYDVVLVNTDNKIGIESFGLKESFKNYFVTAFDLYSLKRGLEIINRLNEQLHLTKILFANQILKEDNEYLDFLSVDSKAIWDEDVVYFPLDNSDQNVIVQNQRNSRIRIRKLSNSYRSSLIYLMESIMVDEPKQNFKKALKNVEKEV